MRKLDPAKKEAILAAAKQRFYRHGIRRTKMIYIAQDVGLSVGTLYLYFRDKDAIIVEGTRAFEDEHLQLAASLIKKKLPADEKLRRYILARFRASQATREGSDHAAEIARAVLRLSPQRVIDEGHLMLDTIAKILQEGSARGLFRRLDVPSETEVFAYAIAYFFPVAGREPDIRPTEEKLKLLVEWFLRQWKRGASDD
jgi:AcrR family transcriptional regulator